MSNVPGINTAILDFCTRLDDGPANEGAARQELPERDPAEYEWLRQAMASIEQPEARMKRLLDVAKKPETAVSTDDAVMEALEELQDMVEDINLATEYDLMKGPLLFLNLLAKTEDPEVRRVAAMVIGNSAQNHAKLQQTYTDLQFADKLIPLMASEQQAATRAALVYAASSICRSHRPAAAAFLGAGGIGALLAVISARSFDDPKSVSRCLRLAAYFAEDCGTTAAPVAQAACSLAVTPVRREDDDEQQPADAAASSATTVEASVASSAAECASAVLKRCISAKKDGAALGSQCVVWLAPWAEKAELADGSTEHKALLAALREAQAAGLGAGESANKAGGQPPVSSTVHLPDAAGAAAVGPVPMLPAPPTSAPAAATRADDDEGAA